MLVHSLQPGSAVYVSNSRHLSALSLSDSGGHGHVWGDAPALASRDVVKPVSSVFGQHRRGERAVPAQTR